MVGVLAGYWIFAWFIDPQSPGDPVWLDVYWLLAGIAAVIIALLAGARLDESAARDGHAAADSFLDMSCCVAG